MKLSNNGTSAIVIVAALIYLGFAYSRDPQKAIDQSPLIVGAAFGLARILQATAEAKEQSKENGDQLAVLAPQVNQAVTSIAENTAVTQQIDAKVDTAVEKVETVATKGEETYGLVDGQMSDFKRMYAEFSALKAELAAERGHAAGITEGREQRTQEAAPAPSAQPTVADAAAQGAADAVRSVAPGSSAGEIADAAAQGAADATEAKP